MSSTFLRQFASTLRASGQPADSGGGNTALTSNDQSPAGPGTTPVQAGNTPAKTDNTKFRTGETVLVKDPDGIDVHFERPDVLYSFEIQVFNLSDLPTSPFFVRFEITDLNWHEDFPVDAGLGAKQNVTAVVEYGELFPLGTDVTLSACVYLTSAPDKVVTCAGTENIMVKDW